MALSAGTLTITVHYGKDLKDCDLFSSMDPYFVITCGNQRFRSQTAKGAGRNPVWNVSGMSAALLTIVMQHQLYVNCKSCMTFGKTYSQFFP